jgi:hypothetical protein
LNWDLNQYCDQLTIGQTGNNQAAEEKLQKLYPGIHKNQECSVLGHPAVITDRHSNILVWYLPSMYYMDHSLMDIDLTSQQATWQTFPILNSTFKLDPDSWWTSPNLCTAGTGTHSGQANLSPAWHQQGHKVCLRITDRQRAGLTYLLFVSMNCCKSWLHSNPKIPLAVNGSKPIPSSQCYAADSCLSSILSSGKLEILQSPA